MAPAVGITGVLFCPLLIVISAVEILCIKFCHYKTTFLQRLFFYLTIAVTIQEGSNIFFLGYRQIGATFLVIMGGSQFYCMYWLLNCC